MNDVQKQGFQRGLNQHGYAFQHRVIREAAKLKDDRKGSAFWDLLTIEQPVVINGRTTRIDFILYAKQRHICWLLVAECKRVNPAFGKWCFTKGAYQRPMWLRDQDLFEILQLGDTPKAGGAGGDSSDRIFDIGFSLKTDQKGDGHPVASDNDALEHECTQSMLGVNGLIELLVKDEKFAKNFEGIDVFTFIPTVFTTASLQTSDVDLRATELTSGEVTLSNPPVDIDWLYYQFPQSPALKHGVQSLESPWSDRQDSWAEIVARDFWRTVVVVNAAGVVNQTKPNQTKPNQTKTKTKTKTKPNQTKLEQHYFPPNSVTQISIKERRPKCL